MVIRDLTLRSAASFGSFHLIRLLYDEYMFYLVEHRVARAKGETPIAVMGEARAHTHAHTHTHKDNHTHKDTHTHTKTNTHSLTHCSLTHSLLTHSLTQ